MLISAFAFSVMSALVKALGSRLPSIEIAFVRAVVTLAISLWQVKRAGLSIFGTGQRSWLILRGVIGFVGLHSYFYAVTALPLADATVLHFLNPLLVALLAPIFLGERGRLGDAIGIVLGLAGVVLVARPPALFGDAGEALPPLGIAAGLMGALAATGAYMVVRKLRSEHPLVVVLQFPMLGVPLTLPLVIPIWVWPTPSEWALLVVMGLFTQLGQLQMTESLHHETAARATALSYAQIPLAILWGFVFWGDVPPLLAVLGTLCIAAGTAMVVGPGQREASATVEG
jgi:drug/metabolite transporter (DMT)-like permease